MTIRHLLYAAPIWMLLLVTSGCGRTTLPTAVTYPATNVDLAKSGVKRIAIGDVQDADGKVSAKSASLCEDLRQALFDLKSFELLDRSALPALVKELSLNQSALINQNTAQEFGKITGASVLVIGRITTYGAVERTHNEPVKYSDGSSSYRSTRIGTATIDVNFIVIDVQTSKIVASKRCLASQNASSEALGSGAPSIDYSTVYLSLREQVALEFARSIAPYRLDEEIALLDENDDHTRQGIASARIGEWEEANGLFLLAAQATQQEKKPNPIMLYNLGISYQVLGKFQEAMKWLKAAYRIEQHPTYEAAVKRCQQLLANQAEINTPGQSNGAPQPAASAAP